MAADGTRVDTAAMAPADTATRATAEDTEAPAVRWAAERCVADAGVEWDAEAEEAADGELPTKEIWVGSIFPFKHFSCVYNQRTNVLSLFSSVNLRKQSCID